MANPVNGRVVISADITTTSEAAWKKATVELEKVVKAALDGLSVTGVTIDAAGLSLNHEISVIESKGDEAEPEEVEETVDDEADEKPKKAKKDKGEKGSKKKGRK